MLVANLAMNQIKVLNESTGRTTQNIVERTMDIFTPHLLKNKETIFSIPRKEESYGSHFRQKLDIYRPPQTMNNSPVLVFLYGGGFVDGDKISANGLFYHNVGSFFARRGITTVIPDYRRVSSALGCEDAIFPSGGEDVSLVMKWLENFDHKGSGNVFIMGSSTGGVHLSNFLLGTQFLEQRRALASGERHIVFKGAIELGVPFHFKSATEERTAVLERYYGSREGIDRKCPLGMLEAVRETGMSREDTAVPNVLLLLGEFDSKDEIARPMYDFAALRTKTWGTGVEFKMIKGHNHISPLLALMSGDVEGERWGEDVAEWILLLNQ